jgi:hypothetical protein
LQIQNGDRESSAMPKVVDVTLVGISVDGKDADVSGRIFGTTFNENPHVEQENRDIFKFPDGPIPVKNGQVTPIGVTTSFLLSTPSTEPATLNGKFLKFGGDLNIGSGFEQITTFDIIQVHQPQDHRVRIISGEMEIRLDFSLVIPSDPF